MMDRAAREALQRTVDALRKRMAADSGDLDYETHLHRVRILQRILDRDAEEAREASSFHSEIR